MSRTRVRAGRMAAVAAAAALVVAVAGRSAGGAASEPADAPVSGRAALSAAGPGHRYVVRPGDTLWQIARARVGPRADPRPMVQELRDANGLGTAVLQPGVTLVLPPAP